MDDPKGHYLKMSVVYFWQVFLLQPFIRKKLKTKNRKEIKVTSSDVKKMFVPLQIPDWDYSPTRL